MLTPTDLHKIGELIDQKLEEKLEKKFEEKLAPIHAKLDILDNRTRKTNKILKDQFNHLDRRIIDNEKRLDRLDHHHHFAPLPPTLPQS